MVSKKSAADFKNNWKKYTDNRYFVYEGNVLRAAQPTKTGAMKYMKYGRRLRKSPL